MCHKKAIPALALSLAVAVTMYTQSSVAQHGATFEDQGGLSMETAAGNFSFEVIGRLQADAAFYDDEVADLGSGTELRRTRIGVQGTFLKDWGYKAEYDFADEDVTLADVYLQYLGFDPLVITVGLFKQPFSLDNITRANDITFMERALTYEAFITPGRRIGAGVAAGGETWSVNTGVFGETAAGDAGFSDPKDEESGEADSGLSAAGRVTYAPLHSETLEPISKLRVVRIVV